MQKQLSVQAFATQRNGQVELLVDFILGRFLKEILKKGLISGYSEPVLQKRFSSEDCSDVFDHYFEVTTTKENNKIQFWLQTTCYKGNELGAPEPNKTYEIRETLIEALGLRSRLTEAHTEFRTIHFTVGPLEYTYPWFIAAKDNAFDLSIYTGGLCGAKDLFDVLEKLLSDVSAEFEVIQAFEEAMNNQKLGFSELIDATVNKLMAWFLAGMPRSEVADSQAMLLSKIRSETKEKVKQSILWSKEGGMNIKGRAIELIKGKDEADPVLVETLKSLLDNKPFLKVGIEALANWNNWINDSIDEPENSNIDGYLRSLWTTDLPKRLVIRRLLIRMHTGENVRYPSDIYVQGISEHNLYGGIHNENQVDQIVDRLKTRYSQLGILSSEDLYALIIERGKALLKDSLQLESYNGTSLKPSFMYVEKALAPNFLFKSFNDAKVKPPLAFHSHFGTSRVDPYSNMKVIVSSLNKKPIAIIKAKYFRKQEFPRRAKEEAYVGLTTKYDYIDNQFVEKYSDLPIIMFVDMDENLVPQEYAITRLVTAGWDVFFSVEKLKEFLTNYAQ